MLEPWRLKMFPFIFPFRMLRLRDLSGLNCSRAHVAIFSSVLRIHCVPWIEGVITVMSSMKARQAGCLMPSSTFGPLHHVSPALSNRFIAAVKWATENVHPPNTTFSSICHVVVKLFVVNLILGTSRCDMVSSTTSADTQ